MTVDLFSTASHFSFRSVNKSLTSTGDDASSEALIWNRDDLFDSETCLMEVEKERAGRLGKAEQRAVVVMVGRRGNMTAVAAMEVEVAAA